MLVRQSKKGASCALSDSISTVTEYALPVSNGFVPSIATHPLDELMGSPQISGYCFNNFSIRKTVVVLSSDPIRTSSLGPSLVGGAVFENSSISVGR